MNPAAQTEMDSLRNIVAEVLVQAARDYRKLKGCKSATAKFDGAKIIVEVELERIKQFFTGGGADAYLELMDGLDLSGTDLWERLVGSTGDGFMGNRGI
jgi:hypothetical protein